MGILLRIKQTWFSLSDKIRFLFVGGLNAGISYVIYVLSVLILGENSYQISLGLAWAISSVTSFTTQRFLVFNVGGNLFKQYLKCCTTWVFSYLINAFLLEILVKKISCNVYLAQIIATIAAAVFTYVLFKKFAFKKG
jgi:putative flippase GtrA